LTLRNALRRIALIGRSLFSVTVSINVSLLPDSAQQAAGLIKCADSAKYVATDKSKTAVEVFCKSGRD
jgi:GGDEF domain-containing protein